MRPKQFTAEDIEGMAHALEAAGMGPKQIRMRLREQGVRWSYQYQGGTGRSARDRGLRQKGLQLCICGQGTFRFTDGAANLCQTCLEKKWAV